MRLDDGNVLEQVTNLQSALDKANASQEQQKTKTMHTEKQREASLRREVQLRSKIDALKGKLEKAEKSVHFHERKVCHDLADRHSVENQVGECYSCHYFATCMQLDDMRKTLAETKLREEKGEAQVLQLRTSISKVSQQSEAWREKLSETASKLTVLEADRKALEAEVS